MQQLSLYQEEKAKSLTEKLTQGHDITVLTNAQTPCSGLNSCINNKHIYSDSQPLVGQSLQKENSHIF